ncbi:hypothetical protein, partial [Pseudomonas sp. EA_15y_Pfl1_P102]|uniref:hypothetical protein n=1 Tax=Pseudomonas sp. EA_15y_Pfl1_P102 TaxID=3088685 RepID=UPI0030DAA7A4
DDECVKNRYSALQGAERVQSEYRQRNCKRGRAIEPSPERSPFQHRGPLAPLDLPSRGRAGPDIAGRSNRAAQPA